MINLQTERYAFFKFSKANLHTIEYTTFGEDLLEEAILIVYNKIKSYDLDYRDKHGNLKPVRFISYIWKRIDGFTIDYLKEEMKSRALYKDVMDLTQTEEGLEFYV
ncbi:MAG: hypothetical protein AAB703_04905 [Pseudomonadota bacterium]